MIFENKLQTLCLKSDFIYLKLLIYLFILFTISQAFYAIENVLSVKTTRQKVLQMFVPSDAT